MAGMTRSKLLHFLHFPTVHRTEKGNKVIYKDPQGLQQTTRNEKTSRHVACFAKDLIVFQSALYQDKTDLILFVNNDVATVVLNQGIQVTTAIQSFVVDVAKVFRTACWSVSSIKISAVMIKNGDVMMKGEGMMTGEGSMIGNDMMFVDDEMSIEDDGTVPGHDDLKIK